MAFDEVLEEVAKWIYFGGFIITSVLTWIFRDYSARLLKHVPQLSQCLVEGTPGAHNEGSCVGKSAVLRISFANFVFFAVHTLLLIGVKRKSDPRR